MPSVGTGCAYKTGWRHQRIRKRDVLDVDIPDIELEGERRERCSILSRSSGSIGEGLRPNVVRRPMWSMGYVNEPTTYVLHKALLWALHIVTKVSVFRIDTGFEKCQPRK